MLIDPCELSPSYVRSIAPYQPGKPISELAREMGLDEKNIVKLASNENPRGIGPRTRAAIDAALGDIARYPDGNGYELKQALSARYGVDMAAIVLGNGSNDVLELVAAAFLGPGRAAVMSQHAFAVYPLATQARGARSIVAAAKNYGHDLEAMARAIDDMEFVARSYAENLQGLRQLEQGAKRLGLDYIPSYGNFITIRVGKAAE